MPKYVIIRGGRPNLHGYKRGDFFWNEELKCYVYKKEIFDETRFNELVPLVLNKHHDDNPVVRLIPDAPATAVVAPAKSEDLDAPSAPSIAPEITLEQAEAIVQRLAPERLKKKPGPKVAESTPS